MRALASAGVVRKGQPIAAHSSIKRFFDSNDIHKEKVLRQSISVSLAAEEARQFGSEIPMLWRFHWSRQIPISDGKRWKGDWFCRRDCTIG
jgi:hypothetical protein